jgi:hypothetical protein
MTTRNAAKRSEQTGRSTRWRMTKLEAITVRDNSAELSY